MVSMTTELALASKSAIDHLTGYAFIKSQPAMGALLSLNNVTITLEGAKLKKDNAVLNSVYKGEAFTIPLSSTRLL